jgi:thiol:disulfide interchange protein
MQNSKLLIIVAAVLLLISGGYFLLRGDGTKESGEGAVNNGGRVTTSDELQSQPENYLDFSTDEYEKVKSEGKVVMLYFTANWCPTCRAQEPINLEAFEELKDDSDIVIFKIHILDSETTEENEKLADEFGVRLQHTYVVLSPQGEVTFTHTGPLVKEDIIKNLLAAKS